MAEKKSNLIKIKKGDETLEINPLMLPQHQALGWEPVEADEPAEEKPKADKPKADK